MTWLMSTNMETLFFLPIKLQFSTNSACVWPPRRPCLCVEPQATFGKFKLCKTLQAKKILFRKLEISQSEIAYPPPNTHVPLVKI